MQNSPRETSGRRDGTKRGETRWRCVKRGEMRRGDGRSTRKNGFMIQARSRSISIATERRGRGGMIPTDSSGDRRRSSTNSCQFVKGCYFYLPSLAIVFGKDVISCWHVSHHPNTITSSRMVKASCVRFIVWITWLVFGVHNLYIMHHDKQQRICSSAFKLRYAETKRTTWNMFQDWASE